MNYHKSTSKMNISIVTDKNYIFVSQRWKYSWLNAPKTTAWTYAQKKDFHNKVDRLIWSNWSSHFTLKVSGRSDFAKQYKGKTLRINFDVQWVLSNEHWNVDVTKIKKNDSKTSSVRWSSNIIKLDTNDTLLRQTSKKNPAYVQYPVVHEFGHAIGNSKYASKGMHGDEYKKKSLHYADKKSLMNIGHELRSRHIDTLISELNTMIPNTTFKVSRVYQSYTV